MTPAAGRGAGTRLPALPCRDGVPVSLFAGAVSLV